MINIAANLQKCKPAAILAAWMEKGGLRMDQDEKINSNAFWLLGQAPYRQKSRANGATRNEVRVNFDCYVLRLIC
jgi:hypothetical protein